MKSNVKKLKLSWIISITLLIFSIIFTGVTFAWFTDKVETEDKTLYFGTIKLDVTDSTNPTSMTLTAGGEAVTESATLMPGDKVELNIKVKLTDGSQPAYYLVYLGHDGLFDNEKQFFFLQDNVVYATDGTTTNKIDSDGSEDTSKTIEHIVGSIDKDTTHTINLTQTIGLDKTKDDLQGSKKISCTIYAIQQANLEEDEAYKQLTKDFTPPTFSSSWKDAITNYSSITKLGFYKTGSQPSTLTLNNDLTSAYDNTTAEDDKGKIQVYSNSGATEIAFVSDKTIYAPSDCSYFAYSLRSYPLYFVPENSHNYAGLFSDLNVTEIIFENFDTSKVTDMGGMFMRSYNLTSLDLSGWDTSRVTAMEYMFYNCSALTNLDLSSFDTSNVVDWTYMLSGTAYSTLTISNKFVIDGAVATKSKLTGGASPYIYLSSSVTLVNVDA